MADVRDILELERAPTPEITKEAILGPEKVKRKPVTTKVSKRPEGMHREVFALLYTDSKDAPPLFPTNTGQGYKQLKAKLGMRRVRPWRWVPFTNPARSDGAVFHHWKRTTDEAKDYPFAKFNKQIPVPTYTDAEYLQHLHNDSWSRQETDHLFDLCRRFDLRFIVIRDRWDRSRFPDRSVEDLKERYYDICTTMNMLKAGSSHDTKIYVFDADHERRRKEQLKRIFERTPEQIEEEQTLINEMKKIEARKKEREKKQQDLQKLITAADCQAETRKSEKKLTKKKLQHQIRPRIDPNVVETAGIKFPDFKGSGVSLRSQRMKLPASVGQKRTKAIEQLLQELSIEPQGSAEYRLGSTLLELNPMPTEDICTHFNELRSDMVLLYELKTALATCEYDLQTLRHQYEALNPGKTLLVPSSISGNKEAPRNYVSTESETAKQKGISEIIDVVGSPGTPNLT